MPNAQYFSQTSFNFSSPRLVCYNLFCYSVVFLYFYTLLPIFYKIVPLGYGLGDRGFASRQWLGIFLFTTASRPALGPTQPPVQWAPGALSLGVKRPVREADHSPPSSAEVKE
jgi:hypothetical protein